MTDRALPLPDSSRVDAAREAVGRAITEYIEAVAEASEDEDREGSIVLAWAVGVEWTSIRLEQRQHGARDIIAPSGQLLSASKGLGQFVSEGY